MDTCAGDCESIDPWFGLLQRVSELAFRLEIADATKIFRRLARIARQQQRGKAEIRAAEIQSYVCQCVLAI